MTGKTDPNTWENADASDAYQASASPAAASAQRTNAWVWVGVALIAAISVIASVWLLAGSDSSDAAAQAESAVPSADSSVASTPSSAPETQEAADGETPVTVTETAVETVRASWDYGDRMPGGDEWPDFKFPGFPITGCINRGLCENVVEAYLEKYEGGKNPSVGLYGIEDPETGEKQDYSCIYSGSSDHHVMCTTEDGFAVKIWQTEIE